MARNNQIKSRHRLHVIGNIVGNTSEHANIFTLRLNKQLNDWIDQNTTGSKNSVINFFVKNGIQDIEELLKERSLLEEVNNGPMIGEI